ncbi:hypothetical protein [Halovivax cerinus]|uniref:Arylsulfatase A family protein n=1 Tax=Halovivax cerinus TaxID=1487865 RepID=A0ABD5NPY4_9EURY|nr:hypothetical protein [Halovivax cerinus]
MVYGKLVRTAYYAYVGAAMSVFSRRPFGTNVFDREWDVLVILDTCRVDALASVASEYPFLDESAVDSIWSVGSGSSEWIASTFREEYRETIRDTAYISANGFAQRVLVDGERPDDGRGWSWSNWQTVDANTLHSLDQPWLYTPDHPEWHTEPRPVTERAIDTWRTDTPDRMILHYSQPHHPYAANARAEGRDELYRFEAEPFRALREGHDREPIWTAYLDQLREVLDDVALLLENLDAETVVISADHGEAFGEWGVLYKHPLGVLHPSIRRVPWVETAGTDTGTYEPTLEPTTDRDEAEEKAIAQLEKLGYVDP